MLDLMTDDPMAKNKPKGKPKAPDADATTRKPMVVQMRGSEEWKAWVEGFAEHEGDTVAKMIERCLRKCAKEAGYSDMPKR